MTAVALLATLAVIAHGGAGAHHGSGLDLRGGLLVAASTLPLLMWRRCPLGVFIVAAAGAAVASGLGYGYPLGIPISPTVALYLLATASEGRRWTRTNTIAVGIAFVLYVCASAFAQRAIPWFELQHTALAWAVAWFAGERTRLLHEHLAQLGERAAQAEREAESERLLAVAEERTRIARDLHDSTGQAINVIAVRAGAARLRYQEAPDRSLAALAEIEEIARQTAAELDGIVHSLRETSGDDVAVAPAGLASLSTLAETHTRSGLELDVQTSGTPRPLAGSADQAAYRILQEGLSNASRHGSGGVSVELVYEGDALRITVVNPAGPSASNNERHGHGLVGMKERASLVGGSLEAVTANGRFRLSARIPYEAGR